MKLGWTGPNFCVATACAAGSHAVGEGARLIREGSADVVLAGGSEAAVTPIAIAAFARMGALSGRHDAPELASRPFDVDRDGFVIGEGAAFLVLERWDRAVARGARIYGEVAGYGRNADAYHITAPSPGGVGRGRVHAPGPGRRRAWSRPTSATSTPTARPPRSTTRPRPRPWSRCSASDGPPVTSTKGATGHLIGAAGAVEAVASLPGHAGRAGPAHGQLRAHRARAGHRRRRTASPASWPRRRSCPTRSGSAATTPAWCSPPPNDRGRRCRPSDRSPGRRPAGAAPSRPRSPSSTAAGWPGSAWPGAPTGAPSARSRARSSSASSGWRVEVGVPVVGELSTSGADVREGLAVAARLGPGGPGPERRIGHGAHRVLGGRARAWPGPPSCWASPTTW